MSKAVRTTLALVYLSIIFAPHAAACSTVCVGGRNSDGTVTVCRNMGQGTWRCANVPAKEAPIEE
jgi:hypothetical protein